MFNLIKSVPVEVWFGMGVAVVSFFMGMGYSVFRIIKPKKCKNPWICTKGSDFTKLHSHINEILTEMRVNLDCARISISQFHNGGDFFSGESILKFSVTHESCALGVEQTIDQQQGVLLTRFVEKLKLLQEETPKLIFTNQLADSHFKGYMESRNTLAFILVPMKTQTSLNPYGYLCAEWCSWSHVDKIQPDYAFSIIYKDIRVLNTLLLNK
jgi:hypothetical protein